MCVTIIRIPFDFNALNLGEQCLSFGATIENLTVQVPQPLMDVIWICIGGVWIALIHLILGVLFCCTIVGIHLGCNILNSLAWLCSHLESLKPASL